MKNMSMLNLVSLVGLCLLSRSGCNVVYRKLDSIYDVSAYGKDVVDATITDIRSSFPYWEDFSLLYRLALMESNFGKNRSLMEINSRGGIWQINSKIYNSLVQNVALMKNTSKFLEKIPEIYGFQCFLCKFNFSSPIQSALAACLYIEMTASTRNFPVTQTEQYNWWKTNYSSKENISAFEDESLYNLGFKYHLKQNLWFMLDATDSLTKEEFKKIVDFTISTIENFVLSASKTQAGLLLYSFENKNLYAFENVSALNSFQNNINSILNKKDQKDFNKAVEEIIDIGFNDDNQSFFDTSAELGIIFVTNDDSISSNSAFLKCLQEINITMFAVAAETDGKLNRDEIKSITTFPQNKSSIFFNSFTQLKEPESYSEVFDKFCIAFTHYNEKETILLCAVVCVTFVKGATENDTTITKEEATKKFEKVFNFNCSDCSSTSSEKIEEISEEFEEELKSDQPSKYLEVLKTLTYFDFDGYNDILNLTQSVATTISTALQNKTDDQFCDKFESANIWFLIDGSTTISSAEFQVLLEFLENFSLQLNNTFERLQLGLSVFAHKHFIYKNIKNYTTFHNFQDILQTVKKMPIKSLKDSVEIAVNEVFHDFNKLQNLSDYNLQTLITIVNSKFLGNATKNVLTNGSSNINKFFITIGDFPNSCQPIYNSFNEKFYHLQSFNQLEDSVTKQIVEALLDIPLYAKINEKLTININKDVLHFVIITVSNTEYLKINLSASNVYINTITFYVQLGAKKSSSVNHDAYIQIKQGIGEFSIIPSKLLQFYPNASMSKNNITFGIKGDNTTDLEITFFVNNLVDLILTELTEITKTCELELNKTVCIMTLNNAIQDAIKQNISEDVLKNFTQILKEFQKSEKEEEISLFDFQSSNNTTWIITALVMILVILIIIAIYKKKLKKKVKQDPNSKRGMLQLIEELDFITEKAFEENAKFSLLKDIKNLLLEIEQYEPVSEDLKNAYKAVDLLEQELEKFKKDLDQKHKVALSSNASLLDIKDFVDQFNLGKSLDIAKEDLEETEKSFAMLSKHLHVMEDLDLIVKESLTSDDLHSCIERLEEKLAIAQQLSISEDLLHPTLLALKNIRLQIQPEDQTSIDNCMSEINKILREVDVCGPNLSSLKNLQTQISLAQQLKVSEESLLKFVKACAEINQTVEKAKDNLKQLSRQCKSSDATVQDLSFLEEAIQVAQNFQFSASLIDSSLDVKQTLHNRISNVSKNLEIITAQAQSSNATMLDLNKLKEQIVLAKNLNFSSEQLKDSYNVLEALQDRSKQIEKDLVCLSKNAWNPEATLMTLNELKKELEVGQMFQMSEEILKESYDSVEHLNGRYQLILKDITSLTTKANALPDDLQSLTLLEEKLKCAEEFGISKELFIESYAVIENLPEKVTLVERNLAEATATAKLDNGTMLTLQQLQVNLDLAKALNIPESEIQDSYNALISLKERTDNVKEALKEFAVLSYESNANFETLQSFQHKFEEAENLLIPTNDLQDALDALERLRFNIDEVSKKLDECLNEADLSTSSLLHMNALYQCLQQAEELKIPLEQLATARDVHASLVKKEFEVGKVKKDLTNAVINPELQTLSQVLDQARAIPYFLTWQPNDIALVNLYEEAIEIEEDLKTSSLESPEDINERNKLREELKDALKNNVERKKLKEITNNFKRLVGRKGDPDDLELIKSSKKRFLEQTKERLLKLLNNAISSRDSPGLKSSLNEVTLALQDDIRQSDIDADPDLKTTIAKAKDLLDMLNELERMKAAIMSLKQPTISEIRSYSQPPPAIKAVMEATLLLLGDDKKKIKEWIEIQALIGKLGKDALKRRIWERNVAQISMSDAEKARDLLVNLKMSEVEEISKAASTFFAWSKCVLMEVQDRNSTKV